MLVNQFGVNSVRRLSYRRRAIHDLAAVLTKLPDWHTRPPVESWDSSCLFDIAFPICPSTPSWYDVLTSSSRDSEPKITRQTYRFAVTNDPERSRRYRDMTIYIRLTSLDVSPSEVSSIRTSANRYVYNQSFATSLQLIFLRACRMTDRRLHNQSVLLPTCINLPLSSRLQTPN